MKLLVSKQTSYVVGGAFEAISDPLSREEFEEIGSNIGDFIGSSLGGSIGGYIGSELGEELGGYVYDHPEAMDHPDYDTIWDSFYDDYWD